MIKCKGVCSSCGRCKCSVMMNGANDRKTKMILYPDDFRADCSEIGLGIAFDIGTTTVVGMLWDLTAGKQIGACAKTNPQNEHGMDVISRITFCGSDSEKLDILRNKIIKCLNEILESLCAEAGREKKEVVRAVVCGNTTMSHIFAGYSPESLAKAPFDPAYSGILQMDSQSAMLDISTDGKVIVTPNIAGHVGGDITSGIIASRLFSKKEMTLFIDIGTNGEIVLNVGGRMLACSTAAGPAFEGAFIRHGMRAADGAIEKVMLRDGEVFLKTIGNHEPQGICGSGLIDAIAQMLEQKLINKNGRLAAQRDAEKRGIDPGYWNLLQEIDGERCFVLAEKEDGSMIVITQKDIREVQLAKGAILAGIQLMLQETGKTADDIHQVIVAGAFGNYIDKKNAIRLGLLPDVPLDRVTPAGNTAGAGVSMILTSKEEEKLSEKIINNVEHIELADKDTFQDTYLKAMNFH